VMKRSRLEICIDILKALSCHESCRITHLMYKVNVNSRVLKDYLAFLVARNCVRERKVGKRGVSYYITQRGLTVLNHFKELNEILPTKFETQRKRGGEVGPRGEPSISRIAFDEDLQQI